jgi:hypothetical protein
VLVLVAALVLMLALDRFVARTRLGRGIRATAQDPETAALMGVNIDRVIMVTFLLGGISGVQLASPPLDFHANDSYFVVAHMHYVLFGGSVFALYAGIYYWFPRMTGRFLDERLGRLHLALTFVGFHLTFLVQHQLGIDGMPRRIADYLPEDGFTGMNQLSSLGSGVLGLSTLAFLLNVWRSLRRGQPAPDDPWEGRSLEWTRPAQHHEPAPSIWPFWIGVAWVLLANGLALGLWAFIPGAVLLAMALHGWVRQSRQRVRPSSG